MRNIFLGICANYFRTCASFAHKNPFSRKFFKEVRKHFKFDITAYIKFNH